MTMILMEMFLLRLLKRTLSDYLALLFSVAVIRMMKRMNTKNLKNLILPFLMTVLMLMPAALAMSLQFSACFDTAVLAMAALLSVKESRRPIVFLFTGIATAYFDLLTYPVFTFGMPAVLMLAMNSRETAGANLLRLVRAGLFWGLGYAGMWVLKWVIAGLFTNQDVIADALKQIGVRTSDLSQDDVTHVSAFECAGRNVLWFIRTPAAALPVPDHSRKIRERGFTISTPKAKALIPAICP